MALFADCIACQDGQHDNHRDVPVPPPRDGVGGQVCRCRGECVERGPDLSSYGWIADAVRDVSEQERPS